MHSELGQHEWPLRSAAPTFIATSESITEETSRILQHCRRIQDQVVQSAARCESDRKLTFEEHILPLALAENERLAASRSLSFYESVSVDADVRVASRRAKDLFEAFAVESAMRDDLFGVIAAVWGTEKDGLLDQESLRFLSMLHQDHVSNGGGLAPDSSKRKRLIAIRGRLSLLAGQFRENLADHTHIDDAWYPADDLQDLPQRLLDRLPKGEGEHEGQIRSPSGPVLRSASKNMVRRRAELLSSQGCHANIAVFAETIILRDEAARLLGYSNHAAYRIETAGRMAKDPETINDFLANLRAKLSVGSQNQLNRLKEAKKTDLETRTPPVTDDGKFYTWDFSYYRAFIRTQNTSHNYAEYFDLNTTLDALLEIIHELLGVKMIKTEGEERSAWHEDVKVYAAWDSDALDRTESFLGYLYLDLHRREGKHRGNSMFTIIPGFQRQDNSRQIPSAAVLWNFESAAATGTCLLPHYDVMYLFHEIGHGVHHLVCKTKYARFHGPDGTPVDFGEAPSQLLENWCWVPQVLKRLGKHYSYLSSEMYGIWSKSTNGEKRQPPIQMPDDMIDALLASQYRGNPLDYLHRVIPCVFDMEIHQPESHAMAQGIDFPALYRDVSSRVYPLDSEPSSEWGYAYTKNEHIMGEYDAGQYAYFFSNIYAADIFHSFFKADPMNAEEGRRYRRAVLEKGGGQDELKTLEDYLGRSVQTDGFYQSLGLT